MNRTAAAGESCRVARLVASVPQLQNRGRLQENETAPHLLRFGAVCKPLPLASVDGCSRLSSLPD